jgi:hypothetical protein
MTYEDKWAARENKLVQKNKTREQNRFSISEPGKEKNRSDTKRLRRRFKERQQDASESSNYE